MLRTAVIAVGGFAAWTGAREGGRDGISRAPRTPVGVGRRLRAPAAPADDHQRPLGYPKQLPQAREVGRRGAGCAGTRGAASETSARASSTSSGSATTTGPGRADKAVWNACAIVSGKLPGCSTSSTHFE